MGSFCSKEIVEIRRTPSKRPTCLQEISYSPGVFIVQNQQAFNLVYELGSQIIGQGLYGEVRICVHKKLGVVRAVKILKKFSHENLDKEWLSRQVEIFQSLDHPNILRLYEFFESFDRYYLVMEYFEGGDLYTRLTASSRLEEKQVSSIMKQVLAGVQYLHSKGIIHRDLKPENILMLTKGSEDCSLKLIDFDTAVFCSVDSQTKGMTGSVFYIAPEVFDGFYNEKCDLWSCGVIMYILLSGSPPFNGLSSYQIVSRIRKAKYSLEDQVWSNISSSAKHLLKKLLEKDPKKRISAVDAYKDPWIRDLSQEARNEEEIQRLVSRLSEFNRTNKLKEAIQTFILTQVMMSEELNVIEKTFQALDKDGDGVISKSELSEYFTSTMDAEAASRETERIFGNLDGECIKHIEFMRIAVESKIWLSHENLRRAFLMFDRENQGKISKEEIVHILSGGLEIDDGIKEHFLNELFGETDIEINMQSFQELLIEKLSSRKCTN